MSKDRNEFNEYNTNDEEVLYDFGVYDGQRSTFDKLNPSEAAEVTAEDKGINTKWLTTDAVEAYKDGFASGYDENREQGHKMNGDEKTNEQKSYEWGIYDGDKNTIEGVNPEEAAEISVERRGLRGWLNEEEIEAYKDGYAHMIDANNGKE